MAEGLGYDDVHEKAQDLQLRKCAKGGRKVMYGWYKLINESSDKMKIAYSVEKNKSCDGILIYDKPNDCFTIEKLSEGADNWITNWLSGHILAKIIMGQISEERKLIATG